ncbi:SHOCT domain-containing protein, partial [Streptomyces sp. MBT57]|nr:SHOCT domain-containing protein [Streptomyces sp. MBT57]
GAAEPAAAGEEGEAGEGDDIITRLERLAELWRRDVLTDAEFAEQKANLLAD